MTYGDFKDLVRRTASDKILRSEAINVTENPKHYRCVRNHSSKVYKFFDKENFGRGNRNENISNKKLAEELRKPIIRKFKNKKLDLPFMDNIWGADLANKELISNFNKGIYFLLCFIDVFSKYAWVIPLKIEREITITNTFQNILGESNRKTKQNIGR